MITRYDQAYYGVVTGGIRVDLALHTTVVKIVMGKGSTCLVKHLGHKLSEGSTD
jgi:hypothetical protein